MSVFRKIQEAIEIAVFQQQCKTMDDIVKYVEWWTGIRNVNKREVERITHNICTQYKAQAK